MTYSALTDDGHYRAAQADEEEKLDYILNIIDRIRAGTATPADADFIAHEFKLPLNLRANNEAL